MFRGPTLLAAGKTIVRYDALARIAKAVKRIREQPEAAHGDGCRPPHQSATSQLSESDGRN